MNDGETSAYILYKQELILIKKEALSISLKVLTKMLILTKKM